MKRIILTIIAAVLFNMTGFTVLAYDAVNANVADDNMIIEYSGGSGTAVISYYDSGSNLCGAVLVKYDGTAYRTKVNKSAGTIRIWFIESNEIKTVHITPYDRLSTPEPERSPEPELSVSTTPTPSDIPEEEDSILSVCRISVSCATAINSNTVSEDIKEHLPSDGIMIGETFFEITGDMTVLDYLMMAADDKDLAVTVSGSYVSAIGAIGEFDGGPLSGWMYRVNGEFLQIPMDGYIVEPEDDIEILYTCNMGNDL